jgi:V8-like Glu-specific endopeptidase
MKTFFWFMFSFLFLSTGILLAQMAEIPFYYQTYALESGYYNGSNVIGVNPQNVFSATVQIDNIPWLALRFEDTNLGEGSYLIIKSLKDGYWQKLNATSLEQWKNASAFFNGHAVEVQLFVAPLDNNIFFKINEVVAGEWGTGSVIESICGPTDDRVASDHSATGRLVNVGCTAWIIPNGKIVSAGHCLDDTTSVNVLEFNVPLSLPNGTIQHPGPEDQYPADVSTIVGIAGGVGNDWGVFEVFPNPITGLMPREAQNAYFTLVQDLGPDSIRITGYGVDGPPPGFGNSLRDSTNQTQQTHIGPNAGSSGTTMRYVTDTQGGNSGSPVIDGATGFALGVHTHGGCSSGNNNGTSFFRAAFWAAVDSGIIPVELEAFLVNPVDDKVNLTWTTATELNNSGFTIERRNENINEWFEVAFVKGKGTTTERNTYTYTDRELQVGTYFYRLKQVDFDGTFTYSPEVEVSVMTPDDFTLFQNYPNPFNPSTKIKFAIPVKTQLQLNVYNILGEKVAEVFSGTLEGGFHEFVFDAQNLSSGVYVYRIESDKFTDSKKMSILK